ncbi:SMC-Scp complex subunit ScpB [Candidatus Nomurabacteria bacterium]|nr:SMC-Scp complex subunit ScpB [Candidatus Nomurabacteria bacterium]
MAIELESKIEGLLFYKGEDVTVKKLSELLNVSVEEIEEALKKLEGSLTNRGLVLVRKDDSVVLGITGELSSIIESIRKEEIAKELSKASLETLTIVLYKNGIARSEIDYIRGVNSSFILRNLLVRGLVEKIVDPKDTRRMLYRPTFDTLSYMGITSIKELPNYEQVVASLTGVINQDENND